MTQQVADKILVAIWSIFWTLDQYPEFSQLTFILNENYQP